MRGIVPLTEQIIHDFLGEAPPRTVRGVAAVKDGKVVGIGGFYRFDTRYILFSDMTDELRADKRLLALAIRQLNAIRQELKLPIQSIEETEFAGSDTLMKHMGLTKIEQTEHVWQA